MGDLEPLILQQIRGLAQGGGGGFDPATPFRDYAPLVAFSAGEIARDPTSGTLYRARINVPAGVNDNAAVSYIQTYSNTVQASTFTVPGAGLQVGDLLLIFSMGAQPIGLPQLGYANANGNQYVTARVVTAADVASGYVINAGSNGLSPYVYVRQYRNARVAAVRSFSGSASATSRSSSAGGMSGAGGRSHMQVIFTGSGNSGFSVTANTLNPAPTNVVTGTYAWVGDQNQQTSATFNAYNFTTTNTNAVVHQISLVPTTYRPDPTYWEALPTLSALVPVVPSLLDDANMVAQTVSSKSTTVATPAVVDPSLSVTFVATPSGCVKVRLGATATGGPINTPQVWGLQDANGMNVPGTARVIHSEYTSALWREVDIVVSDLTPGVNYTWYWTWRSVGAASHTFYWNPGNGGFPEHESGSAAYGSPRMEVWSA